MFWIILFLLCILSFLWYQVSTGIALHKKAKTPGAAPLTKLERQRIGAAWVYTIGIPAVIIYLWYITG